MQFSLIDYLVFITYAITIVSVGLWVSRSKEGHEKNAEDYFLAGKSLPWWAIGASLIAANISAEQFIGMSGSGFSLGLAIASYEWMAAITLIIVGKYFLPIFIEKNIYTIPGFVEVRYSKNLKTILAVFWIGLFIFVNLTSVLFLGAKALDTILGSGNGDYIMHGILGLAFFAAAYSIWGGLSAVAWTDVIQVILLIVGGLVTSMIALNHVTPDGGVFHGLSHIYNVAGDHFHMILKKGHPSFSNLPGIAVLVGGMWVANLYYWGFNQYIIQRTFAAKSLKEAQKGIAFAAFLKLIIPLIVVIPGIVAYVMFTAPQGTSVIPGVGEAFSSASGVNYDKAYPWLISQFVPSGLQGLVLAALAAAIVSSLASMLNSTSTIFTMDIYRAYINTDASDKQTVKVGRITVLVALVIAVLVAPMLGSIKEMFQYIQEYTGLVSPGVLGVFIMGLFYKKSTNNGAIWGAVSSIPIALVLKLGTTLPWMHQMMIVWIVTMIIIAIVSQLEGKGAADPKGISVSRKYFATEPIFNISAMAICVILVALYSIFW
ncbi:MAG: sodium/solute symporter [Candidatus Marinimicrobia bacterium]|jgi:solute:Na+ symporter, SSS family|nr:sodium/solute symporter [Candidatus Neomarinimicrobiota bacterium]MBT4715196.1 sodium/solute symporter [Candidatus Neomarinimicrobiota bacterium]MBT4947370.1 sodium/solute symporter [Candidatus Neomarinimicrobiota bacterium]MBT5271441.1 sodium/solute symporter [Candidatus Neomarinimicrobiota bacterium]MBT6009833.1 sodium/solute symporter [Candidatus Neomarinimicrobiota bacterium]